MLRHYSFPRQILAVIVFLSGYSLQAQVLNVTPSFPNIGDTVTIIYDATQGNGALEGVTPIYAHAGLITDQSTSPTDWKFVQGNWGTADVKVLMEDIGDNKHRIKYHIQSFYGAPVGTNAQQLSFVFRNADGTTVGRSTDGSDIYYDLYASGQLAAAILAPDDVNLIQLGDSITINAEASVNSTLTLFANGSQLTQVQGRNLDFDFKPTIADDYLLEFVANDGTNEVRDSVKVFIRPDVVVMDPPTITEPGITYLSSTSVRLALLAPEKQYVYALGDFNNWEPGAAGFMNQTTDGRLYWLDITGLTPGEEYAYQYFIDGTITVADPYAEKILDPWNDQWIPATSYPNLKAYPTGKANGIVSVLQTDQTPYQWQSNNYTRPKVDDLVVYELLVRDFTEDRTFQLVIDSLNYLANMGITAIELMPIMEFEGNESWGYNPMHFFAVDKYYGTENNLKALIDSCHSRGIAVILDMVLNHAFGQCPLVQMYWDGGKPSANSPWFNVDATHPFNVGFDFNHESDDTKYFADRVLKYWVEEFRFDGYRMDLSKGFTQVNNPNDVGAWSNYDPSRIALLDRMYNELKNVDPDVYFILEHFANNTEEKELSDKGMMSWGNIVHDYNEATMGYISTSNFDWISYQQRGWNDPHVVGYMESHDEERLMYKNLEFGNSSGNYNTKDLNTALARMEQAVAFFLTIPGPKMIWQFGELGYDFSIDFNGRVGNKPVRWSYLQNPNRQKLYKAYAAVGQLRQSSDAFETDNFNLDVGGAVKRIWLSHPDMDVMVLGNFDVVDQNGTPSFQSTGWWYDYFTGDSMNVTDVNMSIPLGPGEFHIYTNRSLTTPDVTLNTFDQLENHPFQLRVAPNPAIGFTEVSYTLPSSESVQITILNLQGQVLYRESLGRQIAGAHSWTWNVASDLPSGLYMIQMQAGDRREVERVMVE